MQLYGDGSLHQYPIDELSKMRIEVIPSGTLTYISVEPTMLDQIIIAQLGDKGVQTIKENLNQKVRSISVFAKTARGYYGSKTNWWFLKMVTSRTKFWMRLTSPNSPCTQEAPKCTMI
jgi:hypothetical protein